MTRQLAFDLPHRAALERDDFFVSASNEGALAALDAWRDWSNGKMVLTGPPGSGKTHLAKVWAAESGARIVFAKGLATADLPDLARSALVVEDCPDLANDDTGQTALFHLHNMMTAVRQPLLLTGAPAPRQWRLALPDLASRIEASPVAHLSAPDDALLCAVLVKLFADRQLCVTPPVIAYLLTRMNRSFCAARTMVATLDAEALARGSAVTRPLAAAILDRVAPREGPVTSAPHTSAS